MEQYRAMMGLSLDKPLTKGVWVLGQKIVAGKQTVEYNNLKNIFNQLPDDKF